MAWDNGPNETTATGCLFAGIGFLLGGVIGAVIGDATTSDYDEFSAFAVAFDGSVGAVVGATAGAAVGVMYRRRRR